MRQKSRGIVLILVMITVSMFVVTPVSAAPPPKTWMRLPVNDYTWIINQNQSNLAEISHASRTYQRVSTLWFTPSADQKITLKKVELDVRTAGNTAYYKITYKFGSGTETTLVTDQLFTSTTYVTKTHTCALNGDFGEALTVNIYTKVYGGDNGDTVYSKNYYMHYDVFNYDWNQWNKYGTEPWLDSDDGNANYIETSGCEYKQKYFEFEDLPAEISAEKVTLFVKLRDPDGTTTGQHLRCYIWNGSQWFLGADWIYDVNTSWRLLCEDITSILDTESKIDNARVYFQKMTDGGHNIRITFCWLLVHDVQYEAPPYSGEFTLTSGEGLASANITSGVLHIQALAEIITIGSPNTATAELWKDVRVWEGIDNITIYYNYSATGLVKAQGLALAAAGLQIYVEDPSGNRIRTITLIDEYLEFNRVVSINKTDAQYDVPLSIPSPGTYKVGVRLDGYSIVHGAGIGLCDFLTGGDGVQVSMIIYPNSPNVASYPWADNFDDNLINYTKWEKLEAGEATVAERNQRLEVTVPSGGSGWAQSGLVTRDYYPMQNFSVEIYVAELDSMHEMTLQIGLTKTTSSDPYGESNWYRIIKLRGQASDNRLIVQRRVDGNISILLSIPWADATGTLQISIWDSTIYFYENNILKYSESYQLSSYDCFIYIFTSTERPYASGMDAFDNFKCDFSVPIHSLTVRTWVIGGSELFDVKVSIDGNPPKSSPVIVSVRDGNHTVEAEGMFHRDNFLYIFNHWENSVADNPRNVTVVQNMPITAYYNVYDQSGGCPFVYSWDGSQYVIDNNLLPASETSNGTDVEDHYKLEQTPVLENGKYKLLISEFEQEYSYLDRVQLIAVDHQSDASIAVSPSGEILTYKEPNPPVIAVDNDNNDVTSLLETIDGNYYGGDAGDYLILDFGDLSVQDGAKLVMRADLPPEEEKWTVHIQVLNDTGSWETIAIVIPRVYWATEIVDLHSYLPDPNGDLKVRLYFTAHHKIDYVGLDTSPQADYELHYANLVSAVHSTQGNVKSELSESDCVYAELLPDEQIELAFTLPENSKDERTFVIYAKGHYYTIAG